MHVVTATSLKINYQKWRQIALCRWEQHTKVKVHTYLELSWMCNTKAKSSTHFLYNYILLIYKTLLYRAKKSLWDFFIHFYMIYDVGKAMTNTTVLNKRAELLWKTHLIHHVVFSLPYSLCWFFHTNINASKIFL